MSRRYSPPITYCIAPKIVLLSRFEFPTVLVPRANMSTSKLSTITGEDLLIDPTTEKVSSLFYVTTLALITKYGFRLVNERCCIKHCWGTYEENSIVNSVRINEWPTEWAIVDSNGVHLTLMSLMGTLQGHFMSGFEACHNSMSQNE